MKVLMFSFMSISTGAMQVSFFGGKIMFGTGLYQRAVKGKEMTLQEFLQEHGDTPEDLADPNYPHNGKVVLFEEPDESEEGWFVLCTKD